MGIAGKGRGITRRQMLAWTGGTALALVFSQSIAAQEKLTFERFVQLSGDVLDRSGDTLDSDYAQIYFDNLLATGQGDGLQALVDGGTDEALVQRIRSEWYTGLSQGTDGDVLVTYTDALMWDALDYTKPMGWCGGETGYWASAPEGEA